jgi:hypothetical protein
MSSSHDAQLNFNNMQDNLHFEIATRRAGRGQVARAIPSIRKLTSHQKKHNCRNEYQKVWLPMGNRCCRTSLQPALTAMANDSSHRFLGFNKRIEITTITSLQHNESGKRKIEWGNHAFICHGFCSVTSPNYRPTWNCNIHKSSSCPIPHTLASRPNGRDINIANPFTKFITK